MTVSQPNWMSDSSVGPSSLPSVPIGVNSRQDVHLLGPGVEAQAGVAAGVAHRYAQHIGGFFVAVGVGRIAEQVDGVMQSDDRGALGHVGQECRREVKIGRGRVLVIAFKRVAVADLARVLDILLAGHRPGKLRWRPRQALDSAAVALEFFHVAEARGPLQQRAHRLPVALDLDLGPDHIARSEAERLYHVDAALGIVEADTRGGGDIAGGSGLIEGLVQFGREVLIVSEDRKRKAESLRGLHLHHVERLA